MKLLLSLALFALCVFATVKALIAPSLWEFVHWGLLVMFPYALAKLLAAWDDWKERKDRASTSSEPTIIGRKVISKEGAAIEVTELILSRSARESLVAGRKGRLE